jgi:anti-sigma regulatory factor (Ser/Thr protein kinase)
MNGTVERGASDASITQINGGPAAAARVRGLLSDLLGDRTNEDTLHDLHLLATELVTNAVRHAGVDETSTLELSVWTAPSLLRVAVIDPGASETTPSVQTLDVNVPGGMGLFLVEQISSAWGVERLRDGGTEVWFELADAA